MLIEIFQIWTLSMLLVMKKYVVIPFVTLYGAIANAQDTDPAVALDFWVGKWELTWKDGNGEVGRGTNRIIKILDGKVIQENFEASEGQLAGFKGTSISVYNPKSKSWHQAWADNQGGYFDFVGEIDGNKKIFKTRVSEKNGKKITQRMVFHSFQDHMMTWDWESSDDGGDSWNLLWQINYKKIKE